MITEIVMSCNCLSSVHRILSSLKEHGVVTQDEITREQTGSEAVIHCQRTAESPDIESGPGISWLVFNQLGRMVFVSHGTG